MQKTLFARNGISKGDLWVSIETIIIPIGERSRPCPISPHNVINLVQFQQQHIQNCVY